MSALTRIEFVEDLGKNWARLEQGTGVLKIQRDADVETLTWVLEDVARWLATGETLHSRPSRPQLRLVGAR